MAGWRSIALQIIHNGSRHPPPGKNQLYSVGALLAGCGAFQAFFAYFPRRHRLARARNPCAELTFFLTQVSHLAHTTLTVAA